MTALTNVASRLRLRRPRVNVLGIGVVVAVIGVWQLVIGLKWIDYSSIPSPLAVVQAAADLIRSGEWQANVGHTLQVMLTGATLAMLIGTTVGLTMGIVPPVRRYLTGTVDFLRSIPVVGLFPVVVLIWGTSAQAEIAISTYGGTWIIIINTVGAVRTVSPLLWDVAKVFRLSTLRTVVKVVIPAAMPTILVGYRLAFVTSFVVSITAEMIVNPEGIGWGLISASLALQPANMWVYLVTAGVIGYLINVILVQTVRAILPGSPISTSSGVRR